MSLMRFLLERGFAEAGAAEMRKFIEGAAATGDKTTIEDLIAYGLSQPQALPAMRRYRPLPRPIARPRHPSKHRRVDIERTRHFTTRGRLRPSDPQRRQTRTRFYLARYAFPNQGAKADPELLRLFMQSEDNAANVSYVRQYLFNKLKPLPAKFADLAKASKIEDKSARIEFMKRAHLSVECLDGQILHFLHSP